MCEWVVTPPEAFTEQAFSDADWQAKRKEGLVVSKMLSQLRYMEEYWEMMQSCQEELEGKIQN